MKTLYRTKTQPTVLVQQITDKITNNSSFNFVAYFMVKKVNDCVLTLCETKTTGKKCKVHFKLPLELHIAFNVN